MTDRKQRLAALADRVEQLQGPDREVDVLIWREIYQRTPFEEPADDPLYTASLDAAMTLVNLEQGLDLIGPMQGSGMWQAGCGEDGHEQADAVTPALALTAAALRAQSETVA